MYSFDNVMQEASGRGYYSAVLTAICYFYEMLAASVAIAPVFLAGFPPSRCRVEPYDNKTLYPNLTNELITEVFIPWNPTLQSPDRCTRKVIDCDSIESCFDSNVTRSNIKCDEGYIYDRSDYEETVITEWDLVCDQYTWVTLSTSLGFFGAFLGSILGGVLADRFGRVVVLRCMVISLGALGCGLAYAPNMLAYTLLHFLEVLAAFAGIVSMFVYDFKCSENKISSAYRSKVNCSYHSDGKFSEIVPSRWRTTCGLLVNSFFGAGCMLLSLYATNLRKWREQHLVKTLSLSIPVFLAVLLLPKSPRWLFIQGRKSEAKKVCRLLAKRNKTELLDSTWAAVEKEYMSESSEVTEKINTLKESFNRPYTRLLMIANMLVWCFNCLVYYGLTMNSGSLAGDPYLNNALSGLMELAACIAGIFSVTYIGFVKSNVGSLAVSTAACVLSTLASELGRGNDVIEKVGTCLAMIGKFGSSMTFGIIYLQTSELFPTCGRSTAVGLASMSARFGSVITPWTIQLQYTIPWLTQAIFAVVSFFGAIIAGFFPETKGHDLTMTYEEAEDFFYKMMGESKIAKFFGLPKYKSPGERKEREALADEKESII